VCLNFEPVVVRNWVVVPLREFQDATCSSTDIELLFSLRIHYYALLQIIKAVYI
jgi:hypothetical protein